MQTKTDIRQAIKRLKAACPTTERARLSGNIVQRVIQLDKWQMAHTLLLYHALPDEVDTSELIAQAVQAGKRVLLPVVVGDDLELREYKAAENLTEGAFHIMEPTGTPFTDYAVIDLAIVPGVAFTAAGQRLGRGRGYYDRLLCRLPHVYKIGICWPFQLLDAIPAEPHDIVMDAIIC